MVVEAQVAGLEVELVLGPVEGREVGQPGLGELAEGLLVIGRRRQRTEQQQGLGRTAGTGVGTPQCLLELEEGTAGAEVHGPGQRVHLLGGVVVAIELVVGAVGIAVLAADAQQQAGAAGVVGTEIQALALLQVVHRVGLEGAAMHVPLGRQLVFQVAAPAAVGWRQDAGGRVDDRVVAGHRAFAVVDVEVAPGVGPPQAQVDPAVEPGLLVGQQAQLVAGEVVVDRRAAEVAAGGALPVARGGHAGLVVEDEQRLLEVQGCAVEAGEGPQIDIGADEQVAAVAETVGPGARVQVLHGQAEELHMGRDAMVGQVVPQAGQRAGTRRGRRLGKAIKGQQQGGQQRAQRIGCIHVGYSILVVFVLSVGCTSFVQASARAGVGLTSTLIWLLSCNSAWKPCSTACSRARQRVTARLRSRRPLASSWISSG